MLNIQTNIEKNVSVDNTLLNPVFEKKKPVPLWYCYLIRSLNPTYPNYTYIGMTNKPKRRIRQHNGQIGGGAKKTKNKGPYEFVCLVEGFKDKPEAMFYEWRFQHPTDKKKVPVEYRSIFGKIDGFINVLKNYTHEKVLTIYINPTFSYYEKLQNFVKENTTKFILNNNLL